MQRTSQKSTCYKRLIDLDVHVNQSPQAIAFQLNQLGIVIGHYTITDTSLMFIEIKTNV